MEPASTPGVNIVDTYEETVPQAIDGVIPRSTGISLQELSVQLCVGHCLIFTNQKGPQELI